tara:strand:+ start:2083 stop:2943 length:861 start_codon:yes stop_codon:yes gene_type:complete
MPTPQEEFQMVMVPQYGSSWEHSAQGWVPSADTIFFTLVAAMAVRPWIIPAGEYERAPNPVLAKDVPMPGTYAPVEAAPQNLIDVTMAPLARFFGPSSYTANAIDVSRFVLIVGSFLGVVTATGAIKTGVPQAMRKLKGREKSMIPIMMALLAAGGTIYGMAEATLSFYALLIPIMIAAGCVALTSVGIVMLGAGGGVMDWGISSQGWWMVEISGLFLGASILIGTLGWLHEKVFTNTFVEGTRDLLGVALVIGRGPNNRWLRFVWPLLVIFSLISVALLSATVTL